MPSVHEILRNTGFTDREIEQLDPRAYNAFHSVLDTAEQIGRSNTEFYEQQIVPALTEWPNEREQIEAARVRAEREANYYKSAAVSAGILSGEATPGTPTFAGGGNNADDFVGRAARGLATIADIDWKHRSLYGSPLPIAPSELISRADALGIDPSAYAEKQFGFAKREQEVAAAKAKEAEARIRDDERRKIMSGYSDGVTGSRNPMAAGNSNMASIRREMKEGQRPDPLKLDAPGRRKAALEAIHKHIEERAEREAGA